MFVDLLNRQIENLMNDNYDWLEAGVLVTLSACQSAEFKSRRSQHFLFGELLEKNENKIKKEYEDGPL